MSLFSNLNRLFKSYLPWIVLVAAALALLMPSYFTGLTAIITYLLQFIMFTMGMTMTFQDFKEVVRRPGRILAIELAQYLAMPFIAFVVAKMLKLPDQIALGLILVGSVPGGTSSNVITYLANGDVPLSIAATSVSTLISPIVTPLMLSLYGGTFFEISFSTMFISIVRVVLVPVLAGLVLNYYFGRYTQKVETVLPSLSSIAVLLVLMGTVAVNRQTIIESGWVIFLAVFVHNVSGYVLGYGLSYWLKLDKAATRAVAIEIGLQNTGLAASLGLAHFSPLAALAGAVGALVHTLFGSIFSGLCAYHDRLQASGTASSLFAKWLPAAPVTTDPTH